MSGRYNAGTWDAEREHVWIYDTQTGAGVVMVLPNHDLQWRDDYHPALETMTLAKRIERALNGEVICCESA